MQKSQKFFKFDYSRQIRLSFETLSFEQHYTRHRAFPLGCDDTAPDSFYFDYTSAQSSKNIHHDVTFGNETVYFPP